jgi:hypothetical protein
VSIRFVEYTFMNSIRFVSIRLVSICLVEYTFREYTHSEYTFCKCIKDIIGARKRFTDLVQTVEVLKILQDFPPWWR